MKARRIMMSILLLGGVALFAQGSYMRGKAWLAQALIAHSWADRLESGAAARKPWPWADIHAVAKLSVPARGVTQYIMNDASGEALAFGAGTVADYAGHHVLAGHRDSHFAFLEDVQIGDEIVLENVRGETGHYRVQRSYVLDTRQVAGLPVNDQDALTLITCYPFNALVANGPLRFVVEAVPIENPVNPAFVTEETDFAVQGLDTTIKKRRT